MHSRHFAVRFAPVMALASAVACASTPTPGTSNVPTPPRGDTVTPVPQQPRGTPTATTFAYRDGTYGYDLQQSTVITVGAGNGSRMEDTLFTTGSITYTVRRSLDTLAVIGTVDSLAVASSRDTAAVPRRLLTPLTVDLRRGMDSFAPAIHADSTTVVPATCDSMEDAARAIARDVHIKLPAGLHRGQRWTDSVVSAVCRGGIPMTATTVAAFEVQDIQARGDSTLVLVVRRATMTLAGTGLQGTRRITVAGNGTSETLFSYDLGAGAFVESTGQSVLELRFETIQQTEQVTQRSMSRVRLRPRGP